MLPFNWYKLLEKLSDKNERKKNRVIWKSDEYPIPIEKKIMNKITMKNTNSINTLAQSDWVKMILEIEVQISSNFMLF